MKLSRHLLLFFVLSVCFAALQIGCWQKNDKNPVAALPDSTLVSSVAFKIVTPANKNASFSASIRPSAESQPFVIFELKLANFGNSLTPFSLVKKQAPVVNGSATVTFESLPNTTVVGSLQIENGNIDGFSNFHGAADLNQGSNIVELAPVGSLMRQDVVAQVIENVLTSPDCFSSLPNQPVKETFKIVDNLSLDSSSVYDMAFAALTTSYLTVPSSLVIVPDDGVIKISWSPVVNADFYNVYYSFSPNVLPNDSNKLTTTVTEIEHSGLTNGVTYYYIVNAGNSFNLSEFSATVNAIPGFFAGGDGSLDSPYKISTPSHLNRIRDHLSSNFILIADIDLNDQILSKESWYSTDYGWLPIGYYSSSPFLGSFDGQGHKISNLSISARNYDVNGLFGYLGESASLKNIILTQCNVVAGGNTGALLGINRGNVSNCQSEGLVSGTGNTGGLVGNNIGTIQNCQSSHKSCR